MIINTLLKYMVSDLGSRSNSVFDRYATHAIRFALVAGIVRLAYRSIIGADSLIQREEDSASQNRSIVLCNEHRNSYQVIQSALPKKMSVEEMLLADTKTVHAPIHAPMRLKNPNDGNEAIEEIIEEDVKIDGTYSPTISPFKYSPTN